MARAVAGLVAAAVAALPSLVPACNGTEVPEPLVSGPTAVQIDRFVRDSLPDFSGQVLVALGDTVILHQAYGFADRESKRPVTLETVFDIGSLTKQFTAAAIIALAERGALAVEDTLARFFPGLPPSKARLTLHQLLTHSSGLPQYSGDDYDPMSAEGLVAWLDTVSLEFSPGERYRYSNPGYSLLALVVERASGLPYEGFLQRRLLGPAGLTHTGYRAPDWRGTELAVGYELGRKRVGTPLDQRWLDDGPSWNLRGNGGMLSTAAEMYRWQHMLVAGRVLPLDAVQRLTTPHIGTDRADRRYGYGWAVRSDEAGRTFVEHTGGNGAFFADVRWYADPEVTFVVTSNAFDADAIRTVLRGLVRLAVDRAGEWRPS
jgi:CubicO group peptidase (beta-lactamase class C family)